MDTHYVPKCAAHFASYGRRNQIRSSTSEQEDPAYFSDEDNTTILKMWPPKGSVSNSTHTTTKKEKQRMKRNDLDRASSDDNTEILSAEEEELRRVSESENLHILISQYEGQPFRPDPLGGDNILMKKCGQKVKLSEPNWRRKQAEILAISKVMAQSQPQLLTWRNFENVSALDLASLSDNAPVATYIARLLESLGYDPNEPNKQGHTVLHLLARKGDDCSDTLERLLKMKKTSNPKERLFRIDVINKGRKTPLDVAATCSHMFSTGKDRAVYTQTINHFQDVIIDEAEGLMNL